MSHAQPDEILTILARDARTPPEKIATMTGRTVAEVTAAIADYEAREVIKCYRTTIDWEKAGETRIFAFVDVKVLPAKSVGFNAVAEIIYRFPEVISVWLISGQSDLRIVVEGDNIHTIGRFVAEKLSTIDGVTGTDTHFVMRRYKEDHILFADQDDDARLVFSP